MAPPAATDSTTQPGTVPPGTVRATPSRSTTAERKSAHKGHGQWALGHLEPLTPNERIKRDDDGLNVRARIENIYAHHGFASIDPADLRGRFRWWGLYTQRKPGIDGGKTAILEPHELDDEFFMLRVRIDGGRLSTEQLRVIGEISQDFARDTADLTDRQNIQLHWIRIEDVPEIWQRLEAVGLSTTEACGDTPRVILGSPVAGIAADEIIDGTPGDRGDPAPLHRLAGVLQPAAQVQDRDQRVAAAGRRARGQRHRVRRRRPPGARAGLRPLGRRRPVDQPDAGAAARRLGAAATRSPTCGPAWSASSATTATGGCAPARGSSSWSPTGASSGSARCWRTSTSAARWSTARRPTVPDGPRDHVGVHQQQDGRYYVGLAPTVGRVSGTTLVRLADIAEAHGSAGSARRRTRRWSSSTCRPTGSTSLVDAADALGLQRPAVDLPAQHDGLHRHRVLQAGHRRDQGARRQADRRAGGRLPDFDEPLTINVNGCPNSCARIQVADIGLKGQLVLDADGDQVEGFQVHLGGGARARRRLRPQAARPQGDRRRAARLRRAGRRAASSTSGPTASASPSGSPAPTKGVR